MRWSEDRMSDGQAGGAARARWRLLALMAASLLTAACEEPAAPELERSEPIAAAANRVVASSPFQPNAVRYRNTGGRASTGRAGSAALSAWALLDAAGRADLTVVADTATIGNPLPRTGPVLSFVQVKSYDADGRLQFTGIAAPGPSRPAARYVLGGLDAGDRVQVQANINGADGARTGVVTVDARVLRRPQLRVESVAAPIRAAARTAVNISALIRETNGDLGALASCVLLVNGVEVDRGWYIWIDAGGSASCVFMHFFPEVGTYDLEVRIEDVQPRQYATGTSSATATMSVIHVPSAFTYHASFEDRTFEGAWRSRGSFRLANGVEGFEHEDEGSDSGRTQNSSVWAWMPRAVTFPLNELIVRQSTRDEVAHQARFLDLAPSWTYEDGDIREACAARDFFGPNGRAWFYLCSREYPAEWGGASTDFSYARYAGQVTYHSRGYSRYWNRDLGIDDVWSWNVEHEEDVGRFVSYGHEYGFFLYIDDGNGIFRMQPLVWLQPFESSWESPWSCWEWSDEWAVQEGCHEARYTDSGMRGNVWGEPTY